MKKTLLLLATAALLLVGCAKEQLSNGVDGGMTSVTFSARVDGGVATKAAADNDCKGANVNRCIMEIYFQDQLYKRMEAAMSGTPATATFANVSVVAGKEYQILFWADHVDVVNTEAGLATDKYYTTKTTTGNKGLKAVTVNKTNFIDALKSKKNDELDAFFFADSYTVPQNQAQPFAVTLKRPFAQLNVITTDVAEGKTVTSEDLLPEKVSVSYEAANTINVATGEISKVGNNAEDYTFTYEASVYGAWSTITAQHPELTLSMNYLLASTDKGAIDVTFKTKNGDTEVMSHSLTNLPYQRNYRTNVKGDLLTANGSWTATIDPIWNEPAHSTVIAKSYSEALNAVSNNQVNKVVVTDNVVADYKEKRAQGSAAGNEYSQLPLSDTEKEALKIKETEDNKKYIMFVLKTTSPVTETFELPDPNAGGEDNFGWYIYHEPQYPTQELDVITTEPDMDVIIDAPSTHATVNGQEYNSVVSYTSPTTLVIPDNVAIKEKIEAKQGNILCFGTLLEGCNVILAPAHDDVPASEFYYGIHSDTSVDNYNTKRTYTPDIINFMVAEGSVTDGKVVNIVNESIVKGYGAEAYTEGGVNLVKSEKLLGELVFDNKNKITIKSGTFADKLTFTTDKVYIENGDFNEVVAPDGAQKFIAGGIYTVKPLAKYIVLGYEATAITTLAGTRYIITKVSSDYIVRITRGGEYLYATGNHLDLKGQFAYVMAYGNPIVQNGDYLELLTDLEGQKATSQISHDGTISWTLDLCGHTMSDSRSDDTFPDSGSSSASVLWAQGHGIGGKNQITFTDSSSEGTGTIENTANDSKAFSAALSLCANNGGNTKWIFNGGNYISKKDAIYYEKGDIIINGGTFRGQNAIKGVCHNNSASSSQLKLTINGGVFDGNISLSNMAVTPTVESQKCHAIITGGVFNGLFELGTNIDLTVSGGKFKNVQMSDYLVDGKILVPENEYYDVKNDSEAPASYGACLNGNTYFLAGKANDAIELAGNNAVVKLKENASYVKILGEGESITILAEESIIYAAPVAAEGFELKVEDVTGGKKYSVPEIKPCYIGNVGYDSLQEGVDALAASQTLKLMKDIVLKSKVTIQSGSRHNATIELNGHKITEAFTSNQELLLVTGSSKQINIKDSKGGALVKNTRGAAVKKGESSGSKGQLMIYGGTFEGSTYGVDVVCGTCNIYGGTFNGNTASINRGWSVSDTYRFNVNGGTFNSDISKITGAGFYINGTLTNNGDGTWTVQ